MALPKSRLGLLAKLSPVVLECMALLVLIAVAYFVFRSRLSPTPIRSTLKPDLLYPGRC
jgi:hypothetical protein